VFRAQGRRTSTGDDDHDALLDRLRSPYESDNPFERLWKPRPAEPLLIGLMSTTLDNATTEDTFILDALEDDRAWAIDWVCAPGGSRFNRDGLGLEVEGNSPDSFSVVARRPGGESRTSYMAAHGIVEWATHVSPQILSQEALHVEALAAEGARVIVTLDDSLLAHRDSSRLREMNLVTPGELAVLVGVWSRATGAGGLFHGERPSSAMYYWALARALTPAGWPAFGALVHGQRFYNSGVELMQLGGSVLSRLEILVRSSDTLVGLWLRDFGNETMDLIAAEFDNVLLRVWAIYDNLALLVGRFLRVELEDRSRWSLVSKPWRQAIRGSGERGQRMLKALDPLMPRIRVSHELRHHAVHRESLGTLRVQTDEGQAGRIKLPARILAAVKAELIAMGESVTDWGIESEFGPHEVRVNSNHGGGLVDEYVYQDPGGAYLDPVVFGVRLIGCAAEVTNSVFAALDPVSDPRLPPEYRTRAVDREVPSWATPEAVRAEVLFSPLAGTVPWAVSEV
jgi:hypothetical protein